MMPRICPACERRIDPQKMCPRCKREPKMPAPPLTLREMLQWPAKLPTLDELEIELMREALSRTTTPNQAAKLIQVGKTTFYRKLPAVIASGKPSTHS